MKYFLSFWLLLFFACKTDTAEKNPPETTLTKEETTPRQNLETPDELLGQLFVDVQLGEVFEDSKTFVDCIAKYPYDSIVSRYNFQKGKDGFDLKAFVLENFEMPPLISSDFKADPTRTSTEHVEELWPILKRDSDTISLGSSLIPLPEAYIVPGGRFREVYYWDSYFTMLGLVESGEFDLIENMLDNFAYLIHTVGHIPNGNRTYYITRSQPPFFAQMVKLMAEQKGDEVYQKYY